MTSIFQRSANCQQSPERWKSCKSNDSSEQSCALPDSEFAASRRPYARGPDWSDQTATR